MKKKTWNISLDGTDYSVQYQGQKPSGTVKMLINGEISEYTPTLVKSVGTFAKLDIADKDVVLKISLSGKEVSLLVNGRNIDNQEPAQPSHNLPQSSNKVNKNSVLQKKVRTGLGSYILFVGFTYVNLVLLMFKSSLSFPFSAMMPQIPLYVGLQIYIEEGVLSAYITGIIISLIFASVYLLLYFLSRKRVVPILVTIVFIGIDTLVLFFLSLEDIGTILIDFAFHVWVLITMINLYRSRLALNKSVRDELSKY